MKLTKLRSAAFVGLGGLLIGLVMLVVNLVSSWSSERAFQQELAALRAAGEPTSLDELAQESVPSEGNGTVLIERLGSRMAEFEDALYEVDKQFIGAPPLPGGRLAAIHVEEYRELLRDFGDLRVGIDELCAAEHWIPSRASITAGMSAEGRDASAQRLYQVRTVLRFVTCEVQVLRADVKLDEAITQVLQLLKLTNRYEAEPGSSARLVCGVIRTTAARIIGDILADGRVAETTHDEIEKSLAMVEGVDHIRPAYTSERVLEIHRQEILVQQGLPPVIRWFGSGSVRREGMSTLRVFDAYIKLADQPWYMANAQLQPGQLLEEGIENSILAQMALTNLNMLARMRASELATLRCCRILNELKRSEHHAPMPITSLQRLNLPSECTTDPYSGQPLIAVSTNEGWRIYSVGQNQLDDQGQYKEDVGINLVD